MTFQEVAKVISCHFVLLVTLPQWIPFVPEKVRKAREAGREFKVLLLSPLSMLS
jgi:hypothetical protein